MRTIIEADINDKFRLVVDHHGEMRALLWFRVSKDSSLYLGPCIENPSVIKRLSGR